MAIRIKKRGLFTEEYKNTAFNLWYQLGKPQATMLHDRLEVDSASGDKPTVVTLQTWINKEFKPKSDWLDAEVQRAINERLVAEKVEMFNRHARTAVHMQDVAIEYIEQHKEELRPPAAIKLLIESIRIERESRGIPEMLAKWSSESDDKLLDRVKELITSAPPELLESGDDDIEDEVSDLSG